MKLLLILFFFTGYFCNIGSSSPIPEKTSEDDQLGPPDLERPADPTDDLQFHDDLHQIIDELRHTAAGIEKEDLAVMDTSKQGDEFFAEESIASLIKAINSRILHTKAHVGATIKKHIVSKLHQVEEHLENFQKEDEDSEHQIATEIRQVEEDIRLASSDTAQAGAEREVADAMKNIGAHIDELNLGFGNPLEEKEEADEIHRVGDALETSLTGRGTLAEESDLAGQIKRMKVQSMPEEQAVKDRELSTKPAPNTDKDTNEDTIEESTLGGILHSVAGLFSGDSGKSTDGDAKSSEEGSPDGDDSQGIRSEEQSNESDEDSHDQSNQKDDDSFYDDAFLGPEDGNKKSGYGIKEGSLPEKETQSDPSIIERTGNSPTDNTIDDLDEDYYEDYHPQISSDKPTTSTRERFRSKSDIEMAPVATSEGRTWHMTAMTVVMCGVVGLVLLVVVGLWYRRFSFRGGVPSATHSVIDDDEDAVYTSTTQPEPQLGRYSKLR